MKYWVKSLVFLSVLCFLLGNFMLYGYVSGGFRLWSHPGAVMIQMLGMGVVIMYGAWRFRDVEQRILDAKAKQLRHDEAVLQAKAREGILTMGDLNRMVEEHGSLSRPRPKER